MKLPGYARVDGAVFYKITRGVEAQLNVENIFGADYFPTANGDNNIAPGAPRRCAATLRFGFRRPAPRRACRMRFRSATKRALLLAAALFVGHAQQEAGVDRHPAFAAVGERQRRAAQLG